MSVEASWPIRWIVCAALAAAGCSPRMSVMDVENQTGRRLGIGVITRPGWGFKAPVSRESRFIVIEPREHLGLSSPKWHECSTPVYCSAMLVMVGDGTDWKAWVCKVSADRIWIRVEEAPEGPVIRYRTGTVADPALSKSTWADPPEQVAVSDNLKVIAETTLPKFVSSTMDSARHE